MRDVQPIFQQHCSECHGLETREGGLRLTDRDDLLLLNDSGEPAIVAGESAASELIRRVTADADERMPPEGDPLTAEQIETLHDWIDSGADWPVDAQAGRPHWAYIVPVRPESPTVRRDDWVRSAIDAFILAKLEAADPPLAPAAVAEPGKLLRRVYLDLIGLPPSIEELDAFIADPSRAHFEQVVNRLLASPQYGEKWARQWLDLARYADSNGYQADQFRQMWAYRDWVIQAMNDDMPFDRFTIEQIAGDLLPDATIAQRIATGFHRCTTCNVEAGVDPEENRVNQIVDRVNTTGTVWLGTSLECAQCHNHKYDPFTQQDYYQLFAFFNNTPLEVERPNGSGVQFEVAGPTMALPLAAADQQRRDQLQGQKQDLRLQIRERREELESERPAWEEQLRSSLRSAPEWHVLTGGRFESGGGQTVEPQEDGSLLLTGENPAKDTYTLTFETELTGITGFRLECLTHESLPGNGPGRGSAERPNFVLYEFEVTATPRTARGSRTSAPEGETSVALHSPTADFSQNNWDVSGLIDGDPATGWAINPRFGQDHLARFLTTEPIGHADGSVLTFTLPQNYGGARTIGRLRISAMTGDPGAEAIPEDVRSLLAVAADERNDKQRSRLAEYHEQQDAQVAELRIQVQEVDRGLNQIKPDTTLVMVELDEGRDTNIFMRGDFLTPGADVEPTTPAALHALPAADSSNEQRGDRVALAEWLVSEDNPLVARVTVNRWWAEFFGRGIVETVEDFGSQGEPPTHPELLDWLAVEFMESGWSMKHVHKLIVMSAAYQQDSRVSPELLRQDPYNRLFARGPRLRMAAETIRDNALSVSGLLSLKAGGPPVYPPQPANIWRHVGRNAPKYETDTDQDRFRRGVYVVWRRSAPYPSFINFDAPDRASCVVKRSRTNTPLQALTLLNDPAYVEMGIALARRMATDESDLTDRQRIEFGFRLCTGRTPTMHEVNHLLEVLEAESSRYEEDTRSANQLIPESSRLEAVPTTRVAAWFSIANILLNLDETITKG